MVAEISRARRPLSQAAVEAVAGAALSSFFKHRSLDRLRLTQLAAAVHLAVPELAQVAVTVALVATAHSRQALICVRPMVVVAALVVQQVRQALVAAVLG